MKKTNTTADSDAWSIARRKLDVYLRAHQVSDAAHRDRLITGWIEKAAARYAEAPDQAPHQIIFEVAQSEITAWFKRVFPQSQFPDDQLAGMGRMSMLSINAAERWPDIFLSDQELPSDFLSAMGEALVQKTPEMKLSRMIPREPESKTQAVDTEIVSLSQLLATKLFCSLFVAGAALAF